MLEKTGSKFVPSPVGLKSVELAAIWKRTRAIMRDAPYHPANPIIAEHAELNIRESDLVRSVGRKNRFRLVRITEDQIGRDAERERAEPSVALAVRFNTGNPNPYVRGPKGKLP